MIRNKTFRMWNAHSSFKILSGCLRFDKWIINVEWKHNEAEKVWFNCERSRQSNVKKESASSITKVKKEDSYIHRHTCTRVRTYECIYLYVCLIMHIRMHVCMFVCFVCITTHIVAYLETLTYIYLNDSFIYHICKSVTITP